MQSKRITLRAVLYKVTNLFSNINGTTNTLSTLSIRQYLLLSFPCPLLFIFSLIPSFLLSSRTVETLITIPIITTVTVDEIKYKTSKKFKAFVTSCVHLQLLFIFLN